MEKNISIDVFNKYKTQLESCIFYKMENNFVTIKQVVPNRYIKQLIKSF